jgi:D-threo-aldose 1-dehydrogenase
MTHQGQIHGRAGPGLPRVLFGTSCLGNLYERLEDQTKDAIVEQSVRQAAPPPVAFDSAGKYGAGLALEVLGRNLRRLGVPPADVLISNKLGWYRVPLRGPEPTFEPGVWADLAHDAEQRIDADGIRACWQQGNELLGPPYRAQLASVHDPDEYLAAGGPERWADVLAAYRSLHELKRAGEVEAIGVGSKDWRVIQRLSREVDLDWVMLACSFTIYRHEPDVMRFIAELKGCETTIINSAVFHAGFLTGGRFFDYRIPNPESSGDAPLFAWRDRFFTLCRAHAVAPAAACVEFALSAPGIGSVSLNTSHPRRVAENIALGRARAPASFWVAMKDAGLIRRDYTFLG